MSKTTTILLIILIIVVGVVGYFIYTSLNKPVITIQEKGVFEESQPGAGITPYAKCPPKKKALSGGCASYSQYLELSGSGEFTKSNENLDYNDAWGCEFRLKEGTPGRSHPYMVTVNCQ